MKKQNFNLVEIIIAMGIVVVCITTIMGLMSAGMKASKDAVENSYGNMILEQISGMVETYPNVLDEIPKSTSQRDETKYNVTTDDYSAWSSITWSTVTAAETACTTAVDNDDNFFKNVYYNNGASSGEKMGILKIIFTTRIDSNDVPDFTAYARLWVEQHFR